MKKGVVTVEDLGDGWCRSIYSPVRNLIEGRDGMKKGKLYNCEGCYILESPKFSIGRLTWPYNIFLFDYVHKKGPKNVREGLK